MAAVCCARVQGTAAWQLLGRCMTGRADGALQVTDAAGECVGTVTDTQLAAEIATMIVGGYETTANVITW